MASSSETNNYENIDITLQDIDNDTPLVVNNEHTVRNVFGGLNKIIKTIVNTCQTKFAAIDSQKKGANSDSGVTIAIPQKTYNFSGFNSNQEKISSYVDYEISEDKYLTHGYIRHSLSSSGEPPIEISSMVYKTPLIYSKSLYGTDVGVNSSSKYGTINVYATIVHGGADNENTSLRIETTISSLSSSGSYLLNGKTFTMPEATISYELY